MHFLTTVFIYLVVYFYRKYCINGFYEPPKTTAGRHFFFRHYSSCEWNLVANCWKLSKSVSRYAFYAAFVTVVSSTTLSWRNTWTGPNYFDVAVLLVSRVYLLAENEAPREDNDHSPFPQQEAAGVHTTLQRPARKS